MPGRLVPMPLVLEDSQLSDKALQELFGSLKTDLTDLEEMVTQPRGTVLDPSSLLTAGELLRSARALLEESGADGREDLARRANLAYSVMLAVIDLVKSHTAVPRVPASSKPKAP